MSVWLNMTPVLQCAAARISRRVETLLILLTLLTLNLDDLESQEGLKLPRIIWREFVQHRQRPRISRRVETSWRGGATWRGLQWLARISRRVETNFKTVHMTSRGMVV